LAKTEKEGYESKIFAESLETVLEEKAKGVTMTEPKFLKAMPLPKIRLTKVQAGTKLSLELQNKSDGCVGVEIEKPALLIETLGAIPKSIVVFRDDLEEFLDSPEETTETELA